MIIEKDTLYIGEDLKYHFADNNYQRAMIDEVVRRYPAKITPYLAKLMKYSEAIRKQYLPSPLELSSNGTAHPFEEGKESSKIYGLERLYRDRVLLTPHFDCPAYCRFCYKKSRVMRNQPEMTLEQIDAAIEEIAKMKEVRGVLITGGEPLVNQKKLFYTIDKVIRLGNITEIRIGTRTLLTCPYIYSDKLCDRLSSYIKVNTNEPFKSKSLAINVHFNHPDELTPDAVTAASKLISRGIILRNQTVLLKGINDNIKTIKTLFSLLLRNRIIPYYFNHCMPIEGSDHLRCSVQRGLDIYKYLCTESATIIPHYVYAPSAGKVHVGSDTKLKYINNGKERAIVSRMPYLKEEFFKITKKMSLPPNHEYDEEGHIIGWYLDGKDE
jgi:lysine 2,3-aminomutase